MFVAESGVIDVTAPAALLETTKADWVRAKFAPAAGAVVPEKAAPPVVANCSPFEGPVGGVAPTVPAAKLEMVAGVAVAFGEGAPPPNPCPPPPAQAARAKGVRMLLRRSAFFMIRFRGRRSIRMEAG